MKTIKEWLEEIPQKSIREKALSNTLKSVLSTEESDLENALSAAFTWNISPEGHDFWSDYVNSL